MTIHDWIHIFEQELKIGAIAAQLRHTSVAEWVAVCFGVVSVLLARVNNVLLYPAGIISTAIYIILFLKPEVGLYAEGLLNGYYLFMSLYGWLHWLRKPHQKALTITQAHTRDWLVVLLITGIGWAVFYYLLHRFTDSTVPMLDAWVSATACAGMWLLAHRKLENWILLNISNICAIPLQLYKQIPLTACLTAFLFIIAVIGYFEWKKIMRQQANSV
jgi:nicotinamide mononucleotide transporter